MTAPIRLPSRKLLMPVLLLGALAGTSACTRIMNNQGYVADQELVASVQPGIDNRQSVERSLGRPTATSQWDNDVWYYISRNTRQLAFARPVARDQSVLIVRFGPDGTVTAVEKRGMEQVVALSPHSDKTPTAGREATFLEDLFGNIGTVGAAPGGGPQ